MSKKITSNQKKTLAKHSKHHSKSHILAMKKDLLKKKSFKNAHKKALKKVGK